MLMDFGLDNKKSISFMFGNIKEKYFEEGFEVPPVFRLPRGGGHATSFSFC